MLLRLLGQSPRTESVVSRRHRSTRVCHRRLEEVNVVATPRSIAWKFVLSLGLVACVTETSTTTTTTTTSAGGNGPSTGTAGYGGGQETGSTGSTSSGWCTDKCGATDVHCAGSQLQTCDEQADGCLDWSPPADCPTNETCLGGQCVLACADQCIAGATQCAGTQLQSCALQSNGCLGWDPAQACGAGLACQDGQCAVAPCTAGTTRCNGIVVELCTSAGTWQAQHACAQACDATTNACTAEVTCPASTRRCSGNVVEVCNATGTAWLGMQTCAVDCTGGLCMGACTPNATRCNGNIPETCDPSGSAWTAGTACTTACVDAVGTCAEPALTINANQNATLSGEHYYAGDATITSQSKLTIPSGVAIIHANNFVLDQSSQIVVAATGNDPRGKGGSCTSHYTLGNGGSHGTAAAVHVCSVNVQYSYCCNVSNAGAIYAIADDEAAPGSAGGGTTGGKGGGLLVVYANNIQIAGSITANGQAGTNFSGGGSGGGVVLRATGDLTFTGSISVAGGADGANVSGGNGGNGVVKLLYGNTKTLTGSVVGAKFESFMPPFDVSSTSHPDPTRWYNDAFTVELAWSRPFTTANGYYENLNTTYGFVPTPAVSQFLSSEAILFQPSAVVVGTNHFHLVTVGPSSNVGTMEHRFVVNINSSTPTVASSSHPISSAWYNNLSPYFTWTLPHADADVTNLYWAFDPYASTIPSKASNAIPMDLTAPQNAKQLLVPNQPAGIWFFHLIAEDTMGQRTKAAAHFRVQLGNDPGQGSVSGAVTDAATSAPLSGVTISLNRGVQTATSGANGSYAFPGTVFAQQYEVTASKTGYQDAVATTTVTANQTSVVSFAMSH